MLPIGVGGTIKSGKYTNWKIEIQDDTKDSGGYFILITNPNNTSQKEGFDDWVENNAQLQQYFIEAAYVIDWPSSNNT